MYAKILKIPHPIHLPIQIPENNALGEGRKGELRPNHLIEHRGQLVADAKGNEGTADGGIGQDLFVHDIAQDLSAAKATVESFRTVVTAAHKAGGGEVAELLGTVDVPVIA